jgi:hypothetical protein
VIYMLPVAGFGRQPLFLLLEKSALAMIGLYLEGQFVPALRGSENRKNGLLALVDVHHRSVDVGSELQSRCQQLITQLGASILSMENLRKFCLSTTR